MSNLYVPAPIANEDDQAQSKGVTSYRLRGDRDQLEPYTAQRAVLGKKELTMSSEPL